MRSTRFIFLFGWLSWIFAACAPDGEKIQPQPETRKELLRQLATPFATISLETNQAQEINLASGISTFWEASNLLDSQNVAIQGTVTLLVRGLVRPADFIRNGAHTMGPGGILNSGGLLEWRLEKDGIDITDRVHFRQALSIRLPADNPLSRMQSLPAWEGEKVALSQLDQAWYWKPGQEIVNGKASLLISNRYFQTFSLRKPGLVLLGQPYADGQNKNVQVQVQVPAGIGNQNSLCYAWFPNLNSLVRLQGFDTGLNRFHTGGYPVPENATVVYLLIHFNGSEWKYQQLKTFAASAPVSLTTPRSQTLGEILQQLQVL